MSSALAVIYYLEDTPQSAGNGGLAWLAGWIFGGKGCHCGAVRVRSGRQTVLALYGLPRPDVAAAYPDEPDAALCGFLVALTELSRDPLRLEWLDDAGVWHEFWRESEATAGRSQASRRALLPDSRVPLVLSALAGVGPDRPWPEAWARARQLLHDCTSRSTPLPPSPDVRAFLDEPVSECPQGRFVKIGGWAFCLSSPIKRLFVRADPGGAVHLIFPKARPDVVAAHAHLSVPPACGFVGMIKLPVPAPFCFYFRLYAELADGSVRLVFSRRYFQTDAAGAPTRKLQGAILLGALVLTGQYRPQSWRAWGRELGGWLRPPVAAPGDPPVTSRPGRGALVSTLVSMPPRGQDPLISLLVPVFNTPRVYLEAMVASVQAQQYPHWELCLADDASTAAHIRPMLEGFARADARIRPVFRSENGHIARATNTALAHARGEFVALLDHDDLLAPEALRQVAGAIRAHASVQFLYTDRDKVDDRGHHFDCERRGAWNPAMAITHNYLHQLTVIRRTLVERAGGFRPDYFGSQDLDLYLRCHELVEASQVVHVPVVGYHWRAHAGSTATRGDQKDYMFDSARRGITDALQRRGLRAKPFLPDFAPIHGLNLHQLRWDPALLRESPVSIVVAADGRTDWQDTMAALVRTVPAAAAEIILVLTGPLAGPRPATGEMRLELVMAHAGVGLAEFFNRGAAVARHPLLLLLQAGVVPTAPGWLEDLAGWLSVPGVDAAGPKLLKVDGRLASAAWTLDAATGRPQPFLADEAPDDLGHQFLMHTARDAWLLDPACLLTRTALFRAVGGYNSGDFPTDYFAADYCLRLHDRGRRVVFTPQAVLELSPQAVRPAAAPGAGGEATNFHQRHAGRTDPWIHPALCLPNEPAVGLPDDFRQNWMPNDVIEFAGGWFFLDQPRPGEELTAGRQTIQGWCIDRSKQPLRELRVRIGREYRLLTYGHPRTDLAKLVGVPEEFYPVGFGLELALPRGRARLEFEAWGEEGGWQRVGRVDVLVGQVRSPTASGLPVSLTDNQFVEGVELLVGSPANRPLGGRAQVLAGSLPWRDSVRHPALPFHGYWNEPTGIVRPVYGGAEVRGWLLHESCAIRRVVASFGLAGWTELSYRNDSPSVSAIFPQFHNSAQCAVVGFVPALPVAPQPLSLRIWAELEDGGWHLVSVRRCWLQAAGEERHVPAKAVSLRTAITAALAFRWALYRGGVPGPGLRALWQAISRVRRKTSSVDWGDASSPLPASAPILTHPHLLLVTHNLNEEGAPYFLLELAGHLRRTTDARLTLVTVADGPLRKEFERQGIVVRRVNREPLWLARTAEETQAALDVLARELRAEEASLVVANTIESFWAVHAARRAGRPALFYIHEPGVFGLHYLGHLSAATRRAAAAAITQSSAVVSFPCQAAQAYYEPFIRRGNHRIQAGWTDPGRFPPADRLRRRQATRARLGLTPGDRLIINVGTMCPRKGQWFFVEAIERLWRSRPALAGACRFLVIGALDNPYGEMLAAQVIRMRRANVTLLPATPEIGDYFAAADLFVLSSFEEGFPRVLLEAMGFGLPIVSTAIHAVPEIARAGAEAVLVPPGDSRAMADALQQLLEDREFARRLGRQAQKRVEENFTAERVLPGHLATIRELVPNLAAASSKILPPELPEPIPAAS